MVILMNVRNRTSKAICVRFRTLETENELNHELSDVRIRTLNRTSRTSAGRNESERGTVPTLDKLRDLI